MASQIPDQPEEKMRNEFSALKSSDSAAIKVHDTNIALPFWRCNVNEIPGAVGYWIGELPDFFAYIVVQPIDLGIEPALEVIRAWVDPEYRGQGMFSALLNCATISSSILVGDRDGMTLGFFNALNRLSTFKVRYFDYVAKVFVSEDDIPKNDKFTPYSEGERWLITITKMN